jgi:TRAP-type C4-dicarboxylate transport system permease small subunit
MRRLLDALYDAAAYLAAVFLVGTLAMVLLGIFARLVGVNVRGTDAYAGYFMAAAGFLALAHTLVRREHIRVSLVLEHVGERTRRALDRVSLGIAAALAIAFAYYSVRLAWQSYSFHDVSTGIDATPLWLPQIAMAAGTVVFAIAFVDEFARELLGARRRVARVEEPAHVE